MMLILIMMIILDDADGGVDAYLGFKKLSSVYPIHQI